MPPAAISRSSTYFPKICGNIAPGYPSAFRATLLATLGLFGCSTPDAHVTTLAVSTHELAADCAVGADDSAALGAYTLALTPLGPFSGEGSDSTSIGLDDVGRELAFDARTVGIDARVTNGAQQGAGPAAFIGHSEHRRGAGIDVLLWPSARGCALSDGNYPGTNAGQALGYSPQAGLALSAGESVADPDNPEGAGPGSALAFDADRGSASIVPREAALAVPRSFATVTSFGDGLLVAGGTNPFGTSSLDASGTAEVFSSTTLGFGTTLELTFRRTRHAAVTLASTGETLLIGGVAPDATDPTRPPLAVANFEAISPATGRSSISGLAHLQIGRVDPTALLLSDGRILVGGGSTPETDSANLEGESLGLVELFSADAKNAGVYAELPPRKHRAFVALPGGGALSVASCDRGSPPGLGDCTCVASDGTECDQNANNFVDAVWMDPDGELQPVRFSTENASAACATPEQPLLVPGSDGSPWLISSPADGSPARLWRFQPWPESATADGNDDVRHLPRFVPTDVVLDPPPDPRTAPVSLGPDAFLWVSGSATGGLAGARLGHRGPLTRDTELLTAASSGDPRPEHLAPDRNPNPASGPVQKASATFDAALFRLTLSPPDAAAKPLTVWVADTLYDDLDLSVALVAPKTTDELAGMLPALAFGLNAAGDDSCAWPTPTAASLSTGQVALHASRRGGNVTLSIAGTPGVTSCAVDPGAVPVGVRAGRANTTLVSFMIERD